MGENTTATPAVARVLVDVDLPQLDHPLDYSIPEDLDARALPGRIVRLRLAGRKRLGWILERAESSDHVGRLSPLESVVSDVEVVPPRLFALARYIANRTVSTASQVLSLAVPARHASTEKAMAREEPVEPAPVAAPSDVSWSGDPGGSALLAHLAHGDSPRAVWTAVPTTVDAQIVDLVRAVRASGRSTVVVLPTSSQVARMRGILKDAFGVDAVTSVTAEDPASHRYRVHLGALAGRTRIVLGTRTAVWTPVVDLGLIIVWDDGDDRLLEQRAPRVSALDVAVARAHLEGAGLVAGAFSRSTKSQALVRSGWAVSIVPERSVLRASTPRVAVPDEFDRDREGAAGGARIPPRVQELMRRQLDEGPVLVQVPMAGYVPVVACARCRTVARCIHCGGPISLGCGHQITCAWCGRGTADWRCPQCAGTELRAVRVGSDRTGEELGRAFPGVPLTVSSSTREITREIDAEPRLVVATPGAEPRAAQGYAAGIILDAAAIAGRPELWAPEEALRRWFNALALVRPGAPAVVLGGVDQLLAQTLIRWDPAGHAVRSLEERAALGFFPVTTIVALDGAARDVEEMVSGIDAEVMGTVPRPSDRSSSSAPSDRRRRPESEGSHGGPEEPAERPVRALLRVSHAKAPALLESLREIQQHRASHRDPMVRLTVNPPELF